MNGWWWNALDARQPVHGQTADSQLERLHILTNTTPKIAMLDRCYRGVAAACGTRLLISHTRRLPLGMRKLLKQHRVVKPMIGHMKADGLLAKNGSGARLALRCTALL